MSRISTYDIVPVPKLSDKLIGTSVGGEIENITYNFTLQELLDLFIPSIPANNLQGVLNFGNTATQDINLFGTITTTNLSVTNTTNLFITYLNEETYIVGKLFDSADSVGVAGQVLTSTGDGVEWYTLPPIFTPTLQQVLTEGNTANVDILLNANIEALDVTAETVDVLSNITIEGTLTDGTSSIGVPSAVLSSTGTGVEWISLPSYSATSPLLFDLGTGVFSIQVANNTQDGYLTSNDWVTFDGKQNAGSYITQLTGEATASGPGSAAITLNNSSVISKVLTGLNVTGGTVLSTDSILTALGKVQNQINSLIGGSIFQGVWDASTNTPTLTSSVGINGHYYIVNVAGTTNLNGITDWQVGDWAIFSGTSWQKVDNTDAVSSVNGYTGTVSLVTGDVLEGAGSLPGRPSQLYFTNARARSSISLTTTGSSGVSTYDSATGILNIPNYAPDLSGYVTLGTAQTITGAKTFSSVITSNRIDATTSGDGAAVIGAFAFGNSVAGSFRNSTTSGQNTPTLFAQQGSSGRIALFQSGTANVSIESNGDLDGVKDLILRGAIKKVTVGATYTYDLPNANGTIALVGGVGVGTVTSVSALTLGTSGTDLNSSVANSTTTPVITLNVPDASETARGVITTGSQTIAGAKTFNSILTLGAASQLRFETDNGFIIPPANFSAIDSVTSSFDFAITAADSTYKRFKLDTFGLTNNTLRTYTLPNANGTLALTSQLTGGTVTSIGLSSATSGVTIGSSPVTTSGTITLAIATASSIQQGLLSSTDWTTFNNKQNTIILTTTGSSGAATLVGSTLNIPIYSQDLTGFVTLGTVQTITAAKTFSTSGSSDTLTINHSSGSGIGLNITKGGNGEGIYVNKTSGSGNALTVIGIANFSVDIVVNGVEIGRGGGNITTNTRVGDNALLGNTTGTDNSAFGASSLVANTTGSFNSAFGLASLIANTTGSSNSAFGYYSLSANVSGTNNTGIGLSAIEKNTTGSNNIGLGVNAGRGTISALNTITDNSIFIGAFTLASANNQTNQIVIGHEAIGLGSNTTVLGNSSTTFGRWWGNLLIGDSTNSGQPLQVTGNMKLTGTLTNGTYTYTLPPVTGTLALTSNITSAISGTTNFIPKFTSSNVIGNSQIFDNGTNVGIGTTNPGVLLHSNPATTTNLVTALFTAGATDSNFKAGFANGSGNASNTEHAKVGMWYGTSGNPLTHIGFLRGNSDNSIGMTFNVNNSEYMRINNAGNVLIGTTTDNGALHQVNGLSYANVMVVGTPTVVGSGSNTTPSATFQNSYNWLAITDSNYVQRCNNTQGAFFTFLKGATEVGSITVLGSTTFYNTTSDYRLKEDLKDYNGLDLLSKIKTYDYEWKSDKKRSYGVLAHELKEVLPYVVNGDKDDEKMQSVDYSKLVPILVKAIQELKAEIDILKNK